MRILSVDVLTEISEQLRDNTKDSAISADAYTTPPTAGHNINGSHWSSYASTSSHGLPSGGSDSRSSSPEGQRPGSGRRKSSVGLTPKNQVVQSSISPPTLRAENFCLMCEEGRRLTRRGLTDIYSYRRWSLRR